MSAVSEEAREREARRKREYGLAHRDEILVRKRKYRLAHRDEIRAYRREYNRTHAGQQRARPMTEEQKARKREYDLNHQRTMTEEQKVRRRERWREVASRRCRVRSEEERERRRARDRAYRQRDEVAVRNTVRKAIRRRIGRTDNPLLREMARRHYELTMELRRCKTAA